MEALRDDDLVLEPTSGAADVRGFSAVLAGERIGTVALVSETRGPTRKSEGRLRWNFRAGPGAFVTSRALRLALRHAFETLGWDRVESRVALDDPHQLRLASIAGLRREGLARQLDGPDLVILARLRTDPSTFTREGFISILNAGLPRKRIIGQGIWRDTSNRVLLCQLTYKSEWDLPGGVIESGESPATGLVRELHEELGIDVHVRGLITVNWLPPWRQWDDASLFVFDLGRTDPDIVETMTLQRSEIEAVHWCTLDEVREHATGATVELLESLEKGTPPPYREAPLQPE